MLFLKRWYRDLTARYYKLEVPIRVNREINIKARRFTSDSYLFEFFLHKPRDLIIEVESWDAEVGVGLCDDPSCKCVLYAVWEDVNIYWPGYCVAPTPERLWQALDHIKFRVERKADR